jgi:hypothetical protein
MTAETNEKAWSGLLAMFTDVVELTLRPAVRSVKRYPNDQTAAVANTIDRLARRYRGAGDRDSSGGGPCGGPRCDGGAERRTSPILRSFTRS